MANKNVFIKARNKNGMEVRLSEVALRIAERHFGITRDRPIVKEVPLELLKLPKKIDIIKTEVPKAVETPIEDATPQKTKKSRKKTE